MSIYIVRLSKWFPFGDEYHSTVSGIVSISKCYRCEKKCRWKGAYGHHSIMVGYGDVYCSKRCIERPGKYKMDKRQLRKFNRGLKKQGVGKLIEITIANSNVKINELTRNKLIFGECYE